MRMTARRMHADEIQTDVPLVRRLLATQLPQWAELSIERVASGGTENAIYRLGDEMAVRPRSDRSARTRWRSCIAGFLC
jgi:aminoglycoside phosphotransferase (APT) family kinase protein